MTTGAKSVACNFCERVGSVTMEPPRRTLARGVDPDDRSLSVIAVLSDVVLCGDHADEIAQGELSLGWCDNERCRLYGEAGSVSPCGEPFKPFQR